MTRTYYIVKTTRDPVIKFYADEKDTLQNVKSFNNPLTLVRAAVKTIATIAREDIAPYDVLKDRAKYIVNVIRDNDIAILDGIDYKDLDRVDKDLDLIALLAS